MVAIFAQLILKGVGCRAIQIPLLRTNYVELDLTSFVVEYILSILVVCGFLCLVDVVHNSHCSTAYRLIQLSTSNTMYIGVLLIRIAKPYKT